jgi:hypothetical protein
VVCLLFIKLSKQKSLFRNHPAHRERFQKRLCGHHQKLLSLSFPDLTGQDVAPFLHIKSESNFICRTVAKASQGLIPLPFSIRALFKLLKNEKYNS